MLFTHGKGRSIVKNNTNYYEPSSLPAAGVGGRCNRSLLNYRKRRTSGDRSIPVTVTTLEENPIPAPVLNQPCPIPCSTSDLPEGTNHYHTEDRVTSITQTILGSGTHIQDIKITGGLQAQQHVTAQGFISVSDERLKNNLKPISESRYIIENLEPLEYEFKSQPGVRRFGFSAQEVQKIAPALVGKTTIDEKEFLAINSVELIPHLVQEIKELRRLISKLT